MWNEKVRIKMNISMVGIDYNTASIEDREHFTLTSDKQLEIAKIIKDTYQASGCIVLSTCNRTEIWFSELGTSETECFSKLVFGEDAKETMLEFCVCRQGDEAAKYLMELGCGIHSQIFGEDQILTQLKQALQQARDYQYVDSVLECLFRTAITAAKKVKTNIQIAKSNTSLPHTIVEQLEKEQGNLSGKSCLVIGNGEMGRLMAENLLEKKCKVWMTLRQYKKSKAIIPEGCGVILYDERYEHIEAMDYIFSATKSHHFTINKSMFENKRLKGKTYYLIDLAIPRDIEPSVEELNDVNVYNMDYFSQEANDRKKELVETRELLSEYVSEFKQWYQFRNLVSTVDDISNIVSDITDAKLTKVYKSIDLSREQQELLQSNVQMASKKAVSKIIFGLRDILQIDQCEEVLQALEQSAMNCADYVK
ncbi:MAG TPA: glutamyl-tRNA reductase [Lachnoclostridium phytofermentans]|uniref:Glutamyl-tRNA reductase n=2 Tax=Lachnoclostridium TaxID=1506553 RepID=A0A3D2XBA2_9FIRM|nr:glutamyl-tRNA reductase [Lachnoclostridium phytofermentans]